jgi:hypothetical protein
MQTRAISQDTSVGVVRVVFGVSAIMDKGRAAADEPALRRNLGRDSASPAMRADGSQMGALVPGPINYSASSAARGQSWKIALRAGSFGTPVREKLHIRKLRGTKTRKVRSD